MNRELLRNTQLYILAHPEQFSMNHFDWRGKRCICGTAWMLATCGWAIPVKTSVFEYINGESQPRDEVDMEQMAKAMDLTVEQFEKLCFMTKWPIFRNVSYDALTAQQASDYIDWFIIHEQQKAEEAINGVG